MKLTIDARLLTSSGIGVYIQNVITSPLLNQFEIRILYNSKDYSFFKSYHYNTKLIAYDAPLYSVKELIETPAKTIGTDIFWSSHYNVPLVNFASTLKVVTIHDVYHLAYYDTLNIKQKIYAKLMMSRAVKSSDVIFTVSEFSKREIVKYTSCNPVKVKVVYNGVNFVKYNTRVSKEKEDEVLLKYKIKPSYILFVGNVKPHKNLKKALQGYKVLLDNNELQFKNTRFVIAGKQEGFITGDDELANIILDPFFKEKVTFTGWVSDEDLPVLYHRASVFIFPSLYEGFGFPPLEAMAAGCPVVSSNAACLPEIYEDAALYFDPLDATSIATALSKVLSDSELRSKLIEKGFAQSKKFSWNTAIENKINIIKQSV